MTTPGIKTRPGPKPRVGCTVDGCDRKHSGHGLCKLHLRRLRSNGDPLAVRRIRGDDERRFWTKVDVRGPDECWPWIGNFDAKGYGYFASKRWRTTRAPRIMWMLIHGAITGGRHVLHRCDNPPCVNPSHLWLGTNQDNVDDKMAKGRWRGRSKR